MKFALLLLALTSLANANGFDVVTVNLPEENRYYALAGCTTQFTPQELDAECVQATSAKPAWIYTTAGQPIAFGAITDNAWEWFTYLTGWGDCRFIEMHVYASYTGYTVQCVRGQIFADGFEP